MKTLMFLFVLTGSLFTASAQTWSDSKTCSISAVGVLRQWEDYFANSSGAIIVGSGNHQSPDYRGCFMQINLSYMEGNNDPTPGWIVNFQYLIHVLPKGWEYVASYNDSSDYGCSIGNGNDAVPVACGTAYIEILNHMDN